ncbi:tyrosine-type recombinase/integrase [Rhizobium sp. CECT 9324]|uniref:tyrosine-type recombinase/integrase n=1 Tax=Rhizobium sp. CECT 9324 TaxID=2845820 RepID=UPI001E56B834|nr:tyrosine-type recombinase/integrase [Rhizobium sp. CECT 9324]CAH0343026.1 Tyrosine recombinase XerC [Rhizobium sp. CECT 9324]
MMNDLNAFAIHGYQVYLLEGKGRNEKTVDAILRHIWQFTELCGNADFRHVDIDQIVRYKTKLQAIENDGAGLSASTIVHAFADVRGFFKWLRKQADYTEIAEDVLEYFTASKQLVQIANAPTDKTYPTHEDVLTVVAAMPVQTFLDRRNRALISFAYLTGVRVGALITLRIKHVDIERRMVKQNAADQVATKNSKTMRTAWLPVGKMFEQIVIDWLAEMTSLCADPETPLFPRGERHLFGPQTPQGWEFLVSDDAVVRIMAAAAADVGVSRFTPHRLRDTIVSMIDKWAVTLSEQKALSQNMGHVSMRTTFERYGPVSEVQQHDLIANMCQRGEAEIDFDIVLAYANAEDFKRKAIRLMLLGDR